MLSNIIIRSAAAFGGAPFRLNKCTALGSTAGGAAGGAAAYPSRTRQVLALAVQIQRRQLPARC